MKLHKEQIDLYILTLIDILQQEELQGIIKSLQDKGLGYRRIADHLNRLEVKTIKGNQWSNSNVYSVLKKYKERKERLMLRDKTYKPIWSRMKIKYQLNLK